MKSVISALSTIAVAMLVSISACNQSPTQNSAVNMKPSPGDTTFSLCYSSTVKKDTVRLNALMTGDSIIGSLGYKLYEKDQNNGNILGKMYGDTIRAIYTFMSEGKESVREVAFLKKGTSLVEGYGNVREEGGKMVFEDFEQLKFNGIVLVKVPCKD